ncbi:MAG TPA: AMP-binding protein [Gemmataceae bacterium]|jgi:long-chain-fatty-acid--[acyl-carrier-protein] ligase|nr:AMP-binding protein [Gemmataceae bacterium]
MLWPVRWFVWAMTRLLLMLRYWVTVRGKDEVLRKPGPYLILPNHPAFADPPNVITRLWPTFRFRPMLLETNFESPLLAPFAWLLRGIRVPDTERASAEARERAQGAVQAAIDALKAGDNVIVWPSGRLQRDGVERLGGARTVADVLAVAPEVTVVLVRTRGLWGSSFSWARGQKINLVGSLLRGAGLLLTNLIIFAPRRRVTMTLEAFTKSDRPAPSRETINPWLEKWFNADVPREEPMFVPYHFLFGPRTYKFPPLPVAVGLDLTKVKAETKQAVAEIVEEKLKRPMTVEENVAEMTFLQLGLDSLDAMEVNLRIEQQFGFTGDTVPTTIGQLWALAAGLLEGGPPKSPPVGWFDASADTSAPDVPGATIPVAILTQAFRHRKQMVVADDLAGGITYERLLVGAGAMAKRFREMPAPNIGLMLPASIGADLAFLGMHLAGKLPVMMNWTTGPTNLSHAARVAGLTHVVTSKAFIDRTQVQVPGTPYLFLEDVRAGIGKFELLRRLLAIRWFPGATKSRLLAHAATDPNAPAVLLFTSGSEKAPKAVPLTHENILSNQRAIAAEFGLSRADAILGFLPMFHSFGLVVTTLLPLAMGIRVVHHPDPTDAGALVRKAAGYKTTLVAGTPTFLGFILDRARAGDLDSVRLLVSGAEACPPALFEKVKRIAPNAVVLEGYGITETAAIVSAHRPGAFRAGTLGLPLPGVEVRVVDLETGERLPSGKMGMMLVSGPNVFPGYLAYDGPSPFREMDGKRWYITGDLGELDPDGMVAFRGRLKRFLKAGGEMISLPALEEPFAKMYPPTDDGPRVAVEGIETADGRRIVLFTTVDISLRDANAKLQTEGFRGVFRLDAVTRIDRIPVLGTGKTDYKALRALIEKETA